MKNTAERLEAIVQQFETLDAEGKQFVVDHMKQAAAGREHVTALAEALEQRI